MTLSAQITLDLTAKGCTEPDILAVLAIMRAVPWFNHVILKSDRGLVTHETWEKARLQADAVARHYRRVFLEEIRP